MEEKNKPKENVTEEKNKPKENMKKSEISTKKYPVEIKTTGGDCYKRVFNYSISAG